MRARLRRWAAQSAADPRYGWVHSQIIGRLGIGLALASMAATHAGYGLAAAAPFLLSLFMITHGAYQGGQSSILLTTFDIDSTNREDPL
jgi:hypothetical protein